MGEEVKLFEILLLYFVLIKEPLFPSAQSKSYGKSKRGDEQAHLKKAEGCPADGAGPLEIPFDILFEQNPIAMWIYDATSLNFVAVNEATCLLYG